VTKWSPFHPSQASVISGAVTNTLQWEYESGGAPILELGPGKRRMIPESVTVGNDAGTDIDVLADFHALPFPDKSFAVAIGHEVLCENDGKDAIRKEILRVSHSYFLRQWRFCFWRVRRCGFKE
jgi:hypothetical protein